MSIMYIFNNTFNTIFNDISKLNNDDNGRYIKGSGSGNDTYCDY
jgi:hypothetical protein